MTFSATLPSSQRLTPERPWVDITMMDARSAEATSMISRAGWVPKVKCTPTSSSSWSSASSLAVVGNALRLGRLRGSPVTADASPRAHAEPA